MSKFFKNRSVLMLSIGLAAGLLVGVGMLVGGLAVVQRQPAPAITIPETLLHASASHGGKSFAMATGMFDPEIEGIFLLDFLTGTVQCWVFNPRPPYGWIGHSKYSVAADLGVQEGKEPNYVMVTGQANFQRPYEGGVPASCILYVADANTGNFAAYTVFWNRTGFKMGQAQAVPFQILGKGNARDLKQRDQ